jgi:hypothetical protein
MTPASARRTVLLAGLILLGGLWIAPALPTAFVLPASVVWFLGLAALLWSGYRILAAWMPTAVAGALVLLALATPVLLTAVPVSPSLSVHLPCPRNWGWMPTWQLRPSPMASLTLTVGGPPVKVCYGQPALRGRTMIGGPRVPFGQLWRTGANEPTTIISSIPLDIAGIGVPPGRSSLYTIPGPETWEIILNRSTSQWGLESQYTEAVKAQEIGRAIVRSDTADPSVERLTFVAGDNELILRWATTRVRIPISAASR